MQTYIKFIGQWDDKTFGKSWRVPSLIKHLQKEVNELAANPSDPEEAADIFITLATICWHQKWQLGYHVMRKMRKNLQHKWREPDKDGVIEHSE